VRFVNVAKKLERVRRQAAAEPDDRPEEIRLREALGIEALGQGEDLIDESSFADLHQRLVLARERSAGGPASGAEPVALEAPPAELPRDAASLEALLAAAPDRDDAGRVAVALARLHVPAAALLIVHRGMVMGLFGDGGELERHIGAVLVPIDARAGAPRRRRAVSRCAPRLSTSACCARSRADGARSRCSRSRCAVAS
jgi:hypothetical protein